MKDRERTIHIIVSLIFLNVLVFVSFQSMNHGKREFARGYIQAENDIVIRQQHSTLGSWQRYGENLHRMMVQEQEQIRMASEMSIIEWIRNRHATH